MKDTTAPPAALAASPAGRHGLTLDLSLFLVMSLVWGTTWVGAKIGITAMPPIFFAALRYVLVAALFLTVTPGVLGLLRGPLGGRVLLTGLLVNTGTYALLLWGMQHVASGIAGLVNLTMIAVGLYALALLRGEEKPSWRHALALLLGMAGLGALFFDRMGLQGGALELWGLLAIILGSFCYCLGSVLSRPLLDHASAFQLTGAQAVTGGAGLVALTLALEPVSLGSLAVLGQPRVLACLGFMVIFGTFVAYTIYLRLMRNWGSARAGLYAFVSPVVALLLGALVFGEELGIRQVLGAALMLSAAAMAVRR
ncbi:DMT family transporter [Pseudoroseomonas ludipueritiae]|uniref:EamA family transporter n=1 Tax=Pseudoroseomonas ludipueritiae TaxID=198093 RepID=A0ABR7RAE7_9PROT|nr:EamA family transporter [Pseudoroseomonas ludipueritiae]